VADEAGEEVVVGAAGEEAAIEGGWVEAVEALMDSVGGGAIAQLRARARGGEERRRVREGEATEAQRVWLAHNRRKRARVGAGRSYPLQSRRGSRAGIRGVRGDFDRRPVKCASAVRKKAAADGCGGSSR